MTTPAIDVYVKLPTGRTSSFQLLPNDRVSKIYDRIAEEERTPKEQILIKYTGKVLKEEHTVGYLGVCRETILKAEIIKVKNLCCYVRMVDGRTIPVEIQNVSPLQYIRNQIQTLEGLSPDRQILKLGKFELKDFHQKVMNAGITDETVLDLAVRVVPDSPPSKTKDVNNAATNDCYDLKETDKEAVLDSFDSQGKQVEVVFSFDTTGSMYSCLQQVRSRLKETIQRLLQHIPGIRIGIMAQADYCDYTNYVLKTVDLTSDVERLVDFAESVPSSGGGDAPECYEWVLHKAQQLDWSEDSAKALVVIGDCEPHQVSYTTEKINWHEELDVLAGMGVKVYGVRAQNNESAAPFYQEISERTGGAYITFKNFDIIADMFLAVCYKEASAAQFEAYCEEIEQQKRDDAEDGASVSAASKRAGDVQAILSQMQQQQQQQLPDGPKRYVARAWWDPSLDHGVPHYRYNAERDSWTSCMGKSSMWHTTPSDSSASDRHDRLASFLGHAGSSAREANTSRRGFSTHRKSAKHSGSFRSMKREKTRGCCIM